MNEGFPTVSWPSCKNLCGLAGIGHEERCSQTKTETTAETSPVSHEPNIHYVGVYSAKLFPKNILCQGQKKITQASETNFIAT